MIITKENITITKINITTITMILKRIIKDPQKKEVIIIIIREITIQTHIRKNTMITIMMNMKKTIRNIRIMMIIIMIMKKAGIIKAIKNMINLKIIIILIKKRILILQEIKNLINIIIIMRIIIIHIPTKEKRIIKIPIKITKGISIRI